MAYTITKQIRSGTPQVGTPPYRQIHAHSTGNANSTAQNEADYMSRKDINTGFYTHVVGNGKVIQVAPVNRGAWDVGGSYNYETYAAVELIESHKTKEEFLADYKIYCELLHDLAKEAGIPTSVDTADLAGIKTHNYCTYNQPNNSSDHVDPIPYLAKCGITLQKFASDVANSKNENTSSFAESKGEIEMYLIQIIDTNTKYKGRWYVSNGVEARYVRTPRMLANYQDQHGKLNLPVDKMYSTELFDEFGGEKNIK